MVTQICAGYVRGLYGVPNELRALQPCFPHFRNDKASLTRRIIELACMCGRYGTPRVTALLHIEKSGE